MEKISLFELLSELNQKRETLEFAIKQMKKRGQAKAKAECNYRISLATGILKEREIGTPVTIISDVCRGNENIANLKMERDIADTLYDTCLQKIYQTKMEINIIENQMNAERKGL